MASNIKSLFIVDGSLEKPILHSQGLPLLRRINKGGVTNFILSFESSEKPLSWELSSDLQSNGIHWQPIRVADKSSGWQRLEVLLSGLRIAFQLCHRYQIDLVHCRSYRPAVIGSLIKLIMRRGYIFDMRGFLIDEQIAVGAWQAKGLVYTIARLLERWCILNADIIIANTTEFRKMIIELPYFPKSTSSEKVVIIPNCVDTNRFERINENRLLRRSLMGWQDRLVILFAGEARDWESFDQIISFYRNVKAHDPKAFLAFICYGDLTHLQQVIFKSKIDSTDYCLYTSLPKEMPDILGAADVGVLFRKSNPFTRTIPSPIKFAEYLSCGLPVVINPGVGDSSEIVAKYNVGVVVDPADFVQSSIAAERIVEMVQFDPGLSRRCRETAQNELSLDYAEKRYLDAYLKVAFLRK